MKTLQVTVIGCYALMACAIDATSGRLPYHQLHDWTSARRYLLVDSSSHMVSPVAALALGARRVLLSEVVSTRLVILDLNTGKTEAVPTRVFRPNAPSILAILNDSMAIAGLPFEYLQAVNFRTAARAKLDPPVSAWGTTPIGQFVAIPGGLLAMAPWSNSRGMPVRADRPLSGPALLIFDPLTGKLSSGLGRIPSNLEGDYLASLEAQVELAGFWADSIIVVNLFSARFEIYRPAAPTQDPLRAVELPRAFLPRKSWVRETTDGFLPEVAAQPQLVDAVTADDSLLVVLRNTAFTWRERSPFSRYPGDWIPEYAIEVYSRQGHLLRGAVPPPGDWRGLVALGTNGCVGLFGVEESRGAETGVLLVYGTGVDRGQDRC